jgi:hypothetical protein
MGNLLCMGLILVFLPTPLCLVFDMTNDGLATLVNVHVFDRR